MKLAYDVKNLDELTLPQGQVIHVQGFPFVLAHDTTVKGIKANLTAAMRFEAFEEMVIGAQSDGFRRSSLGEA